MVAKTPNKEEKKPVHFNLDANAEDFELFESTIKELSLCSRREGFAVFAKSHRLVMSQPTTSQNPASISAESAVCKYLSDEGTLCCANIAKLKKTNAVLCRACLKAQNLKKRDEYLSELRQRGIIEDHELYERYWVEVLGFPRIAFYLPDRLIFIKQKFDEKDQQIEELRKPNANTLAELSILTTELQNTKNALIARNEELAAFATDNEFLRQQLEELKHEPLAEKNAWMTTEIGRKNTEIADLKLEVEKQEKLITAYMMNARRNEASEKT